MTTPLDSFPLGASSLSGPERRAQSLTRLTEDSFDVLVVGGGITGVGTAVDAALRGYRVALIERDDWASGTSSKSSKMVHGGVRYLAQYDFRLVAEAVAERDLLRRVAPHLVRPLPFTVPVADIVRRAEMKAGLTLYDAIAAGRNLARHRRLGADDVRQAAPLLKDAALGAGGYRYWDCRADDARLTLSLAQAAEAAGVVVLNHAAFMSLDIGATSHAVQIHDRIGGATHSVSARWVLNATGVWAAELLDAAGAPKSLKVRPSLGAHIVVAHDRLPVDGAVVFPSGFDDGRMMFAVRWGAQVYVGTTDEDHDAGLDDAPVPAAHVDELLSSIHSAFDVQLTDEDIVGAWAGLRPLLDDQGTGSADLSRRHAIVEGPTRVLSIVGGKLTTYRRMAQDLVDRLLEEDGRNGACQTRNLRLSGPFESGVQSAVAIGRSYGLAEHQSGALYRRHGDQTGAVLELAAEHDELGTLVPTLPYLVGEVRWAVRREYATSVSDVLERRLRVGLRDRHAGGAAVELSASILADELGLDETTRVAQVEDYRTSVNRERGRVGLGLAVKD